ncbi:hypothetical protein O6H91_01G151900 [Diphasiastrum complanatum]|uniref:Uncharacterized protein n=2 Tax=Diphasiastrum complanatum TaxID=34168 RepID=A0ACC2EXR4_DIPCM|nr:hypothetical protein O6H91_Y473600 [Diphasiastrum complanatum]KAJ7571150.1 hypothetical protein O6H91_01G151900 [Diphasiastrum complanatum]KAJ7571151.1 hypothetical protein O6H91_01G151900 [Diphasiastrum complanatum]
MHHLHKQTHVAQQSRREKLRVLGTGPLATQSDLSAGSAKVLEVSQSASGSQETRNSDQFQLSSTSLRKHDGFCHHSSVNDILPLQKTNMMTSDQYNFPTRADLLAAPSKGNSYASASGDIGSLSSPLVGTLLSGQTLTSAAFSNQTSLPPKASSWNNHYPQFGQYTSSNPNSLQGMPANTSCLQNTVEATMLLGTNLQTGNYGNSIKDNLMASFFSGTNSPSDAMQLLLMNGGYNPYSDASTPTNMVLVGPPTGITVQGSHLYSGGQNQQHYIGIPFPSSALSPGSLSPHSSLTSIVDPTLTHPCPSSGFSTTRTNNPNNNWKNEELMFTSSSDAALHMKLISTPETYSLNSDHVSVQNISESGIKPSNLLSNTSDSQSLLQVGSTNRYQTESTRAGSSTYGQSLNLSLSSQRPSGMQLHNFDVQFQPNIDRTETACQLEAENMGQIINKVNSELSCFRTSTRDLVSETEFPHVPRHTHADSNSSVVAGSFNFLSSSKYLKTTQQLLDEVCNVGREIRKSGHRRQHSHAWPCPNSSDMVSTSRESSALQEFSNKDEARLGPAVPSIPVNDSKAPGTSLSLEERHECEMKKAKLLHMLQEVEKRYQQYNDQMQILISSFDSMVGVGSANPYTALALQAMSRYFRCLRDAISGQIQVVCKALGEEDITRYITNRGNNLKQRYMDQQLRQQRAIQQFGMLQQHAWRPQRGLPERSVSILRAWLFEHFLHPYPKDADKMMLARQTGLTRSQVSNWFINARVRLWKPMVEEMYQEEARDQDVEVSVRLTDEAHGSMNYEEGHMEVGASETYCKVDSNLDQSYTNVALVEGNNTQRASEHQNVIEGNVITSDFLPANILSMRKQVAGTMVDVLSVHMVEDGQKERLGLVQNKKFKVNIHEPDILLSNMHMEVDIKSDGTSSNVVDKTDQKFGMAGSRNSTEQYSFPLNGSIHPDVGCFGAYAQGNLNRYGSGGLDSRCPGNGVSLTLGLRHCDSLPAAQQTYLHSTQNITVESRQNIGNNNHEYNNFCEASGKLNGDHLNDPRTSGYHSRKHIENHMLRDFVIS